MSVESVGGSTNQRPGNQVWASDVSAAMIFNNQLMSERDRQHIGMYWT